MLIHKKTMLTLQTEIEFVFVKLKIAILGFALKIPMDTFMRLESLLDIISIFSCLNRGKILMFQSGKMSLP